MMTNDGWWRWLMMMDADDSYDDDDGWWWRRMISTTTDDDDDDGWWWWQRWMMNTILCQVRKPADSLYHLWSYVFSKFAIKQAPVKTRTTVNHHPQENYRDILKSPDTQIKIKDLLNILISFCIKSVNQLIVKIDFRIQVFSKFAIK
jgi:hypothetical protein